MNDTLNKFLNLLFDPSDEICSSPNLYANKSKTMDKVTTADAFISINPILGVRNNENVTKLKTFLVEIDPKNWNELSDADKEITLLDNLNYIKNIGMPYSTCTYSGNKSHHFLISLDQDIKNVEEYKFYYKWLTNIVDKADKQTGHPSISTRLPGHIRSDTFKCQQLIEINKRI